MKKKPIKKYFSSPNLPSSIQNILKKLTSHTSLIPLFTTQHISTLTSLAVPGRALSLLTYLLKESNVGIEHGNKHKLNICSGQSGYTVTTPSCVTSSALFHIHRKWCRKSCHWIQFTYYFAMAHSQDRQRKGHS